MQAIKIFDSKSGTKTELVPLQPGIVKIYVCGMTTYDYCHVGHARVMVFFDVVVRYLRHAGYTVNYVRNITDVDDKIIARAIESNVSIEDLTKKYIDAMHEDESALGNLSPDHEPKASENIDTMIEMISTLISNNHAYVSDDGSVWFDTKSFSEYGKVSGQNISALKANVRKDMQSEKKSSLDFALWKPVKADEPYWDSPWGKGRPGWHIECSAMSSNILGFTLDIHGGGVDLKFPHHENETAQSECAFGSEYVRNWMHVGHVTSASEKMSKSLGNFITIRQALSESDGEAIRYLLLASHYRQPLPFDAANLAKASKVIKRFYRVIATYPPAEAAANSNFRAEFNAALADDFNVIAAFNTCFELTKSIYTIGQDDKEKAAALAGDLQFMLRLLGFSMANAAAKMKSGVNISEEEIEEIIQKRQQARSNRDWQLADKYRDELLIEGIVLEDSKTGTIWRSS